MRYLGRTAVAVALSLAGLLSQLSSPNALPVAAAASTPSSTESPAPEAPVAQSKDKSTTSTIASGVPWYTANSDDASSANRRSTSDMVQAHIPSVLQYDGRFYMLGLDRRHGNAFAGVRCYSSSGLSHWNDQGVALAPSNTISDLAEGSLVQRPHVIYNATTHEFVMWVHIDNSNYSEARVGVAVSSSPCGPYHYLGSSRPLGHQSRDIGLFKDTDGTGYLLTEDRTVHSLRIDRLSADYRQVVAADGPGGSVALLQGSNHSSIEAPAMVKVKGRYYLFGSHLTGFRPNDNIVMSSSSLDGFWSAPSLFAPLWSNTFQSQTAGILTIQGTETTSYIYLGDRWKAKNLGKSTSVWLPLDFSSGTPKLLKRHIWTIDTQTGRWHNGK